MVSGKEQQIVLAKGGAQCRKRIVELAECALEPGHVAAMAVQSVEIYKVGEQQPTLLSFDPFADQTDAFGVVCRMARS